MLNELKNAGLSDNEAKVYLAMLELGPSPVLEIAAKAGVNRPTAYVQIESLKKIGLVSSQNKGSKQLFVAESPQQLEHLLNRESKAVEQKKSEFKEVLPDLLNMFNLSEERPIVRLFEGKDGILRMQDYVLKSKAKEVYAVSMLDDLFKVFPQHTAEYTPKRVHKKIRSKLLYYSSQGPILKQSDAKMLRESRFVSQENLPFDGDLTIFGNSVSVISFRGKLVGIIIEHPEIARSFKKLFDFAWKMADKKK